VIQLGWKRAIRRSLIKWGSELSLGPSLSGLPKQVGHSKRETRHSSGKPTIPPRTWRTDDRVNPSKRDSTQRRADCLLNGRNEDDERPSLTADCIGKLCQRRTDCVRDFWLRDNAGLVKVFPQKRYRNAGLRYDSRRHHVECFRERRCSKLIRSMNSSNSVSQSTNIF
jgi:hypothetical protein